MKKRGMDGFCRRENIRRGQGKREEMREKEGCWAVRTLGRLFVKKTVNKNLEIVTSQWPSC